MERKCLICGEESLELFYKRNYNKCKKCLGLESKRKYETDDLFRQNKIKYSKDYYQNNKEEILIYSKQQGKKWREENKEYHKNVVKEWRRKNPIKHMLQRARKRAKEKNLVYDITENDIIIPDNCPILKIPLQVSINGQKENSPSLDRIDNTKGYIKENIIVISQRANWIKNNASLEELKAITEFLENIK